MDTTRPLPTWTELLQLRSELAAHERILWRHGIRTKLDVVNMDARALVFTIWQRKRFLGLRRYSASQLREHGSTALAPLLKAGITPLLQALPYGVDTPSASRKATDPFGIYAALGLAPRPMGVDHLTSANGRSSAA